MKLSQAKEYLPFVQAAAEGKTIQVRFGHGWCDRVTDTGFAEPPDHYRIKPTPKLRAWRPEEGVGKVVRHKSSGSISIISDWDSSDGTFCAGNQTSDWGPRNDGWVLGDWLIEHCTLLDGSPCGVPEVGQ